MSCYTYHSNKEYFLECVKFLKEHQWIYNYQNTHILTNRVFKHFKEEWLPHLKNISNEELNNLPFGYKNELWPESLTTFLHEFQQFRVHIENHSSFNTITHDSVNFIGVSLKKQHEIVSLAAAIHDECKTKNISFIIDIGAGLGYLSELLYDKYNYNVLGIEGDFQKFELALKNQNKFHSNSKNFVKYVCHFITKDSATLLQNYMQEYFDGWRENIDGVCITGLHACADLSVTILKIFLQLNFVKSIIIMPCCYHRLELDSITPSSNGEKFKNFPVSNALLTSYMHYKGEEFLRRPFLRLACQQSSSSWRNTSAEEHQKHSENCMFRAVLQEAAEEVNCDVKRLKRKTGKFQKNPDGNIDAYVDILKTTHKLVPRNGSNSLMIDDEEFKTRIRQKWNENKDFCYLMEILAALQTTMQGICECLILLDRVEFLKEKGLKCNIYKVTDDRISPRCHALVATKQLSPS